jgi:signal transduction histidine kinase
MTSPAELPLLHEVSRALLFGLSFAEIPEYLCALVVQRLGVRTAWLAPASTDGPAMTPQVVRGNGSIPPSHPLNGPALAAIENAKPVILHDLASDPAWRRWMLDCGYRSAACFPLISTNHVIGVLSTFSDEPGFFDEERASLLQSLTNLAAIALSEARTLELIRSAEETARQQQSELAHLSRLNLLNHLASGLAHEINQPLGAISNFAGAAIQLHRDGKLNPQRAVEVLTEIHQQSQRAGEIVRRLRGFMRKGAHELVPCDLNTLVADSVALMGAELSRARVRANVDAAIDLPRVRVDPVQIQQVIVNLIQNAIDAMADTPPQARSLHISIARSEGEVVVRFTDAGKGIPSADLPRVFDSFFSTKSNGLGLGLNISRSIVESHGGSLTARNNGAGGGATFEFVLPSGGSTSP